MFHQNYVSGSTDNDNNDDVSDANTITRVSKFSQASKNSKATGKSRRHSETKATAGMDISNLEYSQKTLLERTWFCGAMSFLAITNMFLLGIEADTRCREKCTDGTNSLWTMVNQLFTAIFVADIILAIVVLRPRRYFFGDAKRIGCARLDWFHTFDILLVFLRVLDVWMLSPIGVESDLRAFSALRVMHLISFAKQVQLIDGFRELWLILAGMAETIRTVAWVAVLLLLVTWVFAVAITMGVNDGNIGYDYHYSYWKKDDYWGTTTRSVYSLFQVLTRDKWSGSLVWPIVEARTGMVVLFIAFITIASLALLNTIIGAVVESTLRSARDNEEKENKKRMRNDTKTMASLEKIFTEADKDGSGDIDEQELSEMVQNPKVRKALHELGIPVRDVHMLFDCLAEEQDKTVRIDVFFRGCTRLRGPAMARDLQHVHIDMGRHVETAGDHIRAVRSLNDSISAILDTIDGIETGIVKDPEDELDPILMARRSRNKQSRATFLRHNLNGETDERSDAGSGTTESSLPLPTVSRKGESIEDRLVREVAAKAGKKKGSKVHAAPQPAPPPIPAHLKGKF